MRIPNPICWLRSAWYSLVWPGTLMRSGYPTEGHHYTVEEEHDGCRVKIFKCKECGHIEIGWSKAGREELR